MRSQESIGASLLLCLSLSACVFHVGSSGSDSSFDVRGSGILAAESREVEEFDRVSVRGAFTVVIRAGEPRSVVLRGDDNVLEHVRTQVRDGRLEVSMASVSVRYTSLEVEISTPALGALSLSGFSRLDLAGLDAGRFELSVSGSVSGKAAGKAEHLAIAISGSAELDLAELEARAAEVRVSGSGKLVLHASEHLDARISGSGTIRYVGDPEVRTSISGSGSVQALR